ncbi:carbohydrate kinase, FGGY family protein [Candidatus Moduliflexus flocculans]|uniref:Carbohydrate kinase, FGGY family protein n=1 Tax=Candidatus Moduliflexus flocculans TaxID=1499966 RepID=A0A081BPP8_9BACT|nr:carbohydrate kinase, FGGY family protein [Candidatus Moduliflexus flocculans]
MAAAKHFLAFDLGASSGRGVVGILKDDKLSIEELHRFSNGPTSLNGSMYWDVLGLFREMLEALFRYKKRYAAPLNGIGFDTWGVDYGLLAKDGSLVGNPYHYRDHRTDGMVERVGELAGGRDVVFNATGIQFIQLNTLYQLYAAAATGSPQLEIADTLLMMPALFTYFFTGTKVNEFTDVTTTQMYDPRSGTWAIPLLQQLGIPTHILNAPIVQPGTIVDRLLPEIAEMTGLGAVPVIASASHDTASAVAAVPAKGEDWAYLSSGTWSLLGLEIPQPIITPDVMRYNITNEGGVGKTFRFLKNISGLWLVQECKRIWERQGAALNFGDMMREAEAAAPFKAAIHPDDPCFLNPSDMSEAIVGFCKQTGQSAPSSRGEMTRCILESLACTYRFVLDSLEMLRGKPIDVLHIVGGGVQNTLLCQFAANATGKPVMAGPVEATAIGNIMMQAIATGDIGSIDEGREWVKRSCDVVMYEPQQTAQWEDAYQRFCGIIQAK